MYIVQCTVHGGPSVTGELERLVAEIPEELKKLVDADERTNKEVVQAALWREFGGERKGALERRAEEQRQRIGMLERERNERNRELEAANEELERIETLLEQRQSEKEQLLTEARETLSGTPRDPDNPAIQYWAEELGMKPAELLKELE